jgi:hypothetical protein
VVVSLIPSHNIGWTTLRVANTQHHIWLEVFTSALVLIYEVEEVAK